MYQYSALDVPPKIQLVYEAARDEQGADLVQEGIDIALGKSNLLATSSHIVALLNLLKQAGVFA